MTFCHFQVEIDDHTKRVSRFSVVDAFHDGGWTPDFKMKSWPSTAFSLDMSIYDRTWYQGEYSPLSMVRTQSRHPNTTISSVPANEIVLVNAIIKFRAGKHTDDIGIKNVKSPFHVPWVWCETLLTYAGGRLKVYGRGSQFPSHAWYVGDKRVHTQSQTADSEFPVTRYGPGPLRHLQIQRLPGAHLRGLPSPALTIAVKQLKLYPILAKGAPAHGPQQGLDARKKRTGAIDLHAYTVGGRAVWSKSL